MDAGGTTRASYTATGKLASFVKTIDGSNYTHAYDYAGRLTHLTYPDGSYVDYAFTNGGNLSTVSLNGTVMATWPNYTARGEPKKVEYGSGVGTTYDYDTLNHLTSLSTIKGATTFQNLTYDWYTQPNTHGLVLGKITDNRSNKLVPNCNPGGASCNTDETQTYSYDALYRLTQAVGVWGTKAYAYDSTGNPTTFGGLVNRTLNYNGTQVTSGTGLSGVTYDGAGNMLHKVLDGVTWDYTWTAENQMNSAIKNGALATQMVYDADGYRVKKVYTPASGPAVTTTYVGELYEKRAYSDGTSERHTFYVIAQGQVIAQVTRSGNIAIAFNDANRWRTELAAASLYSSRNIGGAVQKAYHYLNAATLHPDTLRRIMVAIFALFAAGVLAALLASRLGHSVAVSSFSPGLRLASLSVLMLFTLSACGGGGPGGEALYRARDYLLSGDTTQGPAIGTYFFHRNHVNSSSVVTNENGAEVTRIVYLSFGEISQPNSSGSDTITSKFTGQEYDEETGLHYYNARHYDSVIGRFISADSMIPNLFDPQTFNRYSYVRNSPIAREDPTGHFDPDSGIPDGEGGHNYTHGGSSEDGESGDNFDSTPDQPGSQPPAQQPAPGAAQPGGTAPSQPSARGVTTGSGTLDDPFQNPDWVIVFRGERLPAPRRPHENEGGRFGDKELDDVEAAVAKAGTVAVAAWRVYKAWPIRAFPLGVIAGGGSWGVGLTGLGGFIGAGYLGWKAGRLAMDICPGLRTGIGDAVYRCATLGETSAAFPEGANSCVPRGSVDCDASWQVPWCASLRRPVWVRSFPGLRRSLHERDEIVASQFVTFDSNYGSTCCCAKRFRISVSRKMYAIP